MSHLPITRMTLYKHGVGFYERRATLATDKIELSFRVEEMDDILKSLTAIDWDGGQILGIDYATPQSRDERLEGCSIRLSDSRSLQDLLVSLRGRRVTVLLDQAEAVTGTLVGLDDAPTREPLATALVSVLGDGADHVRVVPLARVQGVQILDERGAGDLRFFLQTSLSQEAFRSVTIRLTPGEPRPIGQPHRPGAYLARQLPPRRGASRIRTPQGVSRPRQRPCPDAGMGHL